MSTLRAHRRPRRGFAVLAKGAVTVVAAIGLTVGITAGTSFASSAQAGSTPYPCPGAGLSNLMSVSSGGTGCTPSTPPPDEISVFVPGYLAKTDIDGRDAPTNSAKRTYNSYRKGDTVGIVCQAYGDNKAGSTLWDWTSKRVWVPDAYVKTGHDGPIPGVPRCGSNIPGIGAKTPAKKPEQKPGKKTPAKKPTTSKPKYIAKTDIDGRNAPTNSAKRTYNSYRKGAEVGIVCQAYGDNKGGSTLWDWTTKKVWVPDVYVKTGTDGRIPGMALCTKQPHQPKKPTQPKKPPPTTKPAQPQKIRVVAMGDSYAAGEGAPPFDAGSGNCDRSKASWQRNLQIPGYGKTTYGNPNIDYVQVSCTGAVTADIIDRAQKGTARPQIAALTKHEDYVLLSIGGNDASFADVVQSCLFEDCMSNPLVTGGERKINSTVIPRIRAVLERVAKDSGHAKILLAGYPELMTKATANSCRGQVVVRKITIRIPIQTSPDLPPTWVPITIPAFSKTLWEISQAESDRLDYLVRYFGTQTRKLTESLRTRAVDPIDVRFVDTARAFHSDGKDHGACSGLGNQWINSIVGGWDKLLIAQKKEVLFHPNGQGYAAYTSAANAVIAHW